jgi:hypothetical protein
MKTHHTRHSSDFFTTLSALAAACLLLAACSGGSQPPTASAGPAGPATTATASGPVAVQPVAFTPGPKTGAFTQCNIESFDRAAFPASPVEAALAMPHYIAGWVAEPHATNPVYWLRLEDKAQGRYLQMSLVPSIKRADVVAAQGGASTPLASGFELTLPGHGVVAGRYHAYVAAVDGDTTSLCDNGRYVDFK